ncbi:MAG: alpha/beta hydrolase [Chitinophagales bacterium]|nr:alpha/beta hydrolase [Chitinophagales bacterium]MDW8392825.1 alpha/beta hydrolase [Chitinophagales bacterium]
MQTDDGVMLYLLEIGNPKAKQTVLVLHGGFGAEHSYLIDAVLPLSRQTRFLLFDHRGSLRSPAPDSLISYQGFLNDIEGIKKKYGLNHLSFLAHFNGCTVALDYLYHFPQHVQRMALTGCPLSFIDRNYFTGLDSAITLYKTESERMQQAIQHKIEIPRVKYHLNADQPPSNKQRTLLRKIEYAAYNTFYSRRVEHMPNAFFNPEVFANLQRNEPESALDQRAARLSATLVKNTKPLLLINGQYDFVDPQGHAWNAASRQVPGLTLVLVPNAGHNIWQDQRAAFKKSLNKSLK